MFQFAKQTPELICMNGFSVCFELNNYLKYFLIFVNLPLRILTPYLVAFLCFLELLFQKGLQFIPWSARQPRRYLEFHYT